MTDYEHVPSPACHGRGHIRVEEAAKIAGVSIEEARARAGKPRSRRRPNLNAASPRQLPG